MKIKRYQKDDETSYALGAFPSLEILAHRPQAVRAVLVASGTEQNLGVQRLREKAAALGLPLHEDDRTLERLSGKGNVHALCLFEKFERPARLGEGGLHLALHEPSDMGNLGTILRTALGFGARGVHLIRPAADLFAPRVVRASMGAVAALPFSYYTDAAAFLTAVQASGRPLYGFARTEAAASLPRVAFGRDPVLLFGAESSGLPEDILRHATAVAIPQPGPVDSFNLSVAVAIGLYAATQELSG